MSLLNSLTNFNCIPIITNYFNKKNVILTLLFFPGTIA